MKKHITKIMSAASAILLAASAMGVLNASAEEVTKIKRASYRVGDLDGDKKVTLDDALGSLEIYTAAYMGGKAEMNKAADIDNNGKIDLDDALSILQYYTGSLLGEERLWADIRPVTNVDSTKYRNGDGEPWSLNDMYLEIGCAAGAPGEEVTVPVYIAGASKIAGFQYYQLIPDGFELTKIDSPTFTSDLGTVVVNTDAEFYDVEFEDPEAQTEPNPVLRYHSGALIFVANGGQNVDVADGAIIGNFTYKIPETATPGDYYPISCEIENDLFVTHDLDAYNYTLIDGIILVK